MRVLKNLSSYMHTVLIRRVLSKSVKSSLMQVEKVYKLLEKERELFTNSQVRNWRNSLCAFEIDLALLESTNVTVRQYLNFTVIYGNALTRALGEHYKVPLDVKLETQTALLRTHNFIELGYDINKALLDDIDSYLQSLVDVTVILTNPAPEA